MEIPGYKEILLQTATDVDIYLYLLISSFTCAGRNFGYEIKEFIVYIFYIYVYDCGHAAKIAN